MTPAFLDASTPGVEAYAAIEAVNWSTLVHLATSPKMLRWRVEHPRPDTRALVLGRAIHCAVLEPERFERAYIVEPDFGNLTSNAAKAERAAWLAELAPGYVARPCFDGRTKAGKEARAAFLAGLPPDARVLIGDEDAAAVLGVETISADDHALVQRCAEAVRAHPVAAELLRGGRSEEVITWTDRETGLACKARLDFIRPSWILDLKSTRQPTIGAMARDFAGRLYHGQLGFYHEGAIAAGKLPTDADLPRVIAVQTVEPYDVVPARLAFDSLVSGISLGRYLLRRYAECQAAEWWPGLAPGLVDLELPVWAASGEDDEDEDEAEGDRW